MLDVVVSDNTVTITGKMILPWSCMEINSIYQQKMVWIPHLQKMLYSSNLSLCESSWKILECTLFPLLHYPSLNLPTWYTQIGGKTSITILVLPWGIFHIFTSERDIMVRAVKNDQDSLWHVNDTLCDIWHQCQGLYHWVTEGGDCMNPDICTVRWYCKAPFTNC